MKQTIEKIPKINNQLQQFTSSITTLINQNNEYANAIKRYSNKTHEIEINGNELNNEQKTEIENLIDQLDEINKRNDIAIQNVNAFLNKINQLKENINDAICFDRFDDN